MPRIQKEILLFFFHRLAHQAKISSLIYILWSHFYDRHWFPEPDSHQTGIISKLEASLSIKHMATYRFSLPLEYTINDVRCRQSSWVGDCIYRKYPIFFYTVTFASSNERKVVGQRQEGQRNHEERAFCVSQFKWRIIGQPSRSWPLPKMPLILWACAVLYNLIVKDGTLADTLAKGCEFSC